MRCRFNIQSGGRKTLGTYVSWRNHSRSSIIKGGDAASVLETSAERARASLYIFNETAEPLQRVRAATKTSLKRTPVAESRGEKNISRDTSRLDRGRILLFKSHPTSRGRRQGPSRDRGLLSGLYQRKIHRVPFVECINIQPHTHFIS